MSAGEIITAVFTGLIFVATAAYVVYTQRLWRVSQRQHDTQTAMQSIQRDLRALQLIAHKHANDPDLRAYGEWEYSATPMYGDNGSGTKEIREVFEEWEAQLHLWNTGSSTILITDWTLDADEGSNRPRMWQPDVAIPLKPPIVVPAHSSVQVRADVSGRTCRRVFFHYETAASSGRELPIILRTRFFTHYKPDKEDA